MIKYFLFPAVFFLISITTFSQEQFTKFLSDELDRNMAVLKKQEEPPYYISLRVNEKTTFDINALYGNITKSEEKKERVLHTSLRVGSHELDNFHEIRESRSHWFAGRRMNIIGIEDDEKSIKQRIWKSIDESYRDALNTYNQVKANIAVKVEGEDESDDFSIEKPEKYFEPPVKIEKLDFDVETWENRLREYSAVFLKYPDIYDGKAGLDFKIERRVFVSTEGTQIEESGISARLFIDGKVKADDGMELPLFLSYFAFLPEDLPDSNEILKDVEKMAESLVALRTAPVAEPYEGPAMLSGVAAGVFFHEIFGHRIEGHRLKRSTDGQTFKNRIGDIVLPEHLSVIFDPQETNYKGEDLYGHYKYDCQGVKGQKVTVVENGILKDFLMSRTPIEDFPNSNGHGRAYAGREPVSRQSNMFIKTTEPLSIEELREEFRKELKSQNKEFGFSFETVRGGFTMTGRFIPNAFNVSPLLVYKVFADGREDEMVRGVDLIGTPLAMFSQIIKAADDYGIFQGNCGAESGWVQVSSVSPSLLVRQIETQKNIKSQDRPFILEAPDRDF